MPLYYYTARTPDGKPLRGSIDAASDSLVIAALRTRSLIVTSLESASTLRGSLLSLGALGTLNSRVIATFYRAFATLIRCGVPIRRALAVTIDQCNNPRLAEALRSIANDVENGVALSEAMVRHPKEFARIFVAMVRAGEAAGALDVVLERLATFLEHQRALRKKLASSLAYPAVIVLAAAGILGFLLATVVPMFAGTYQQMRLPLPAITAILMAASSAIRSGQLWIAAMVALVSLTIVWGRYAEGSQIRRGIDAVRLRAPIFGALTRKTALAQLSRTMGTLLQAGVPFDSALELGGDVIENVHYRESLAVVRASVHDGRRFSDGLSGSGLYDALFVQLLIVGEETGTLDSMLFRIADFYDADVDAALATLAAVIEPFLILWLGGAVAFIVAAIFLPLYTLIGSIK